MMKATLLRRLREAQLPEGSYAVFGSGPLCIRDIRPFGNDLDVIVTEDVWNAVLGRAGWERRTTSRGGEYLWNDDVELWKDWGPGAWDIGALIAEAEVIDGLPFVRLERVIEWKKFNGREKDLRDVALAEEFLRNE